MKTNLEKLVDWLNGNKRDIFEGTYDFFHEGVHEIIDTYPEEGMVENLSLLDILFDHSVAKKAFGESMIQTSVPFELASEYSGEKDPFISWRLHLRHLALLPTDKEKLEYFLENLKG